MTGEGRSHDSAAEDEDAQHNDAEKCRKYSLFMMCVCVRVVCDIGASGSIRSLFSLFLCFLQHHQDVVAL